MDREDFEAMVFNIVRMVPEGRATSYGAIAKAIGYPNHSRLVGKIMGGSSALDVPAHRVVNSQGQLSGRDSFTTSNTMQQLLEAEGVVINNNRIATWDRVFWNPIDEIEFDE